MSKLKRRLLKYELRKAGFSSVEYIPELNKPDGGIEPDKIRTNLSNSQILEIGDEGIIKCGSGCDRFAAVDTIRTLVYSVNEAADEWKQAEAVPFEELKQYFIRVQRYNFGCAR